MLELIKLIYDPYIPPIVSNVKNPAHQHQENLVKEYLNALRKINGIDQIGLEVDDDFSGNDMLWSISDTIKALRFLTDNFASFKSGGSSSGIKVPSQKQR